MRLPAAALAISLGSLPLVAAAQAETRTISTSGSADVRVVPDEIAVTLGIETRDKSLAAARRENDERLAKVMAALRGLKIDSKNVQTDYVNIEPEHSHDRAVALYWVRKNIAVTVKDPSTFESLLTQVLDAGANHVHNVQFRTTELRKYRDQARAMAIRAAQEKAVVLAKELGQKVGKARTISEGGGGWYGPSSWGGGHWNSQSQNVMQSQGGGESSESSGMSLGQITVNAAVTVVFDLE